MDRGFYDYQRPSIRKICDEIDKTLLSYLNAEESLEKIDHKKKLEDYIKCFLSQVPHSKKFTFNETAHVLHRSIVGLPELPFYKINAAWTALINYAQHLVVQPWRKEFREIKTYCGYFKHHIGGSLIGGEIILQLMGYQKICEGTLVLEGPVDPDKVTCVTRDAFIALVECQIMRFIYEELINYHNNLSWCDLLHYRETHPGPPEFAVQELKLCSPRYQYCRPSDLYPKRTEHYPYVYTQPRYHSCQPHGQMYGVLSPQQTLPPNYTVYPPMNGYVYRPSHRDCQPVPSAYNCTVPTAQLIEFDTSHQNNDINYYVGASSHKRASHDYSTENRLGSRLNEDFSAKKFKHKDIEGSHERIFGVTRASSYVNDYDVASCSESIKNFRLDETDSSTENRSPTKTQELKNGVRLNNKQDGGHLSVRSLNREKPKKPAADNVKAYKGESEMWACTFCTYDNDKSRKVCEMCDKSRFQENEPLEIGGRQCKNCTLVNLKGTSSCAVCGESLEDSSTYI